MHRSRAVTLLACLLASAAAMATVYRWVDEQGQVHYGEVVPEKYRATARPVGAPATEPSAEQQREAQERARKEKAQAAALGAERAPAKASAAASRPAGKRPVQLPNEQTDCETWQRLYLESLECFGPYRTVRGGTKPEAFEACNAVPEPPSRCRPRLP